MAALALADSPNPDALEPLITARDDSDEPLREAAALALHRLAERGGAPDDLFEKPAKPKGPRVQYPYEAIEEKLEATRKGRPCPSIYLYSITFGVRAP